MTLEKLRKAQILKEHIDDLADLKDELSVLKPIKVGSVAVDIDGEDVEALKKTLEERISKLKEEFEAL